MRVRGRSAQRRRMAAEQELDPGEGVPMRDDS